MKKIFVLGLFALIFGFMTEAKAQRYPVLYFCESYGSEGETGVSDRFTTGYLTVMVKADDAIGLRDCSIQLDKYNLSSGTFSFYKKFKYSVEPDMKYIFFARNDESDLSFDTPGIYRVFLLDHNDRTVASALVEIISK
ncbi:MAG: hypothetical protein K1X85_03660 [Ignavibacteria bacterium]|nr:hypothetical protein [Ignavibacteria bacterium]